MDKDKNIQKELEDLSPFLAHMKSKKEAIEAPDNYFHYLENSVMQQVELENTPITQPTKRETVSLLGQIFSLRGIVSLASILLLVVAAVYYNQAKLNTSNNSLQLAELTDTEILNYLTENADELDIYTLDEINEELSVLDMIDLEENEVEYILEDSAIDIFGEDLF